MIQEGQYSHFSSDYKVRELYPAYQSQYLPCSVKQWILHGTWNAEAVSEVIQYEKKRATPQEPWERVNGTRIAEIDDDVLQKGFGDFLLHAYDGVLSLNDYALFIENVAWAKENEYELPYEINWEKIILGIKKQIEEIKKSAVDRQQTAYKIPESCKEFLPKEAVSAYSIISDFQSSDALIFYKNLQLYVEQIGKNLSSGLIAIQNKRFDTFSIEMAEITAEAFFKENNSGKEFFVPTFKKIWGTNLHLQDIVKEDCIRGLQ